MAARNKARRRRPSALIDIVAIANKLPWWASLIFGLLVFALFYFAMPAYFEYRIANAPHPSLVGAAIGRRLYWLKVLGVAALAVSIYFAIRNLLFDAKASRGEKTIVRFLGKWFGRDSQ